MLAMLYERGIAMFYQRLCLCVRACVCLSVREKLLVRN